jgi:hypothetical protein
MVSEISLAMRHDTHLKHDKHKVTFLNIWTVGMIIAGILLLMYFTS